MATELKSIEIDKCIVDAEVNTRQRGVGDITDLIASIKVKGILEPLIGKDRENDNGEVEICAGFRRHAAAVKLGLSNVPVMVHKRRDLSKKKMLEINIIENVMRKNLNPMDEALAFQQLQTKHKSSVDEICASLGVRKSRVQQRLRLLKLEESVQSAVHASRIPVASALEIDRLPKKKQDKYVGIAEDLGGEKLKILIDRELEKLQEKMSVDVPESKSSESDPADVTENIRTIKACAGIICNGLGYSSDEKASVKSVNFRLLDPDDLRVVAGLFNGCADQVPEDVDFNDKAQNELIEFIEGGTPDRVLDDESPVVRQMLIRGLAGRAKEIALEKAKKTGKRAKVTYILAKEVIDEFYAEVVEE